MLKYLNQFLQFHFDILETTNVVPSDVRHFDNGLTKCTWTAFAHSVLNEKNKVNYS